MAALIARFLAPVTSLALVAMMIWAGFLVHQRDAIRADFATYQAAVEQQARKASEAARAAEAQIHVTQEGAIHAANLATSAAQADAVDARSAADRLRQRARALAATNCPAGDTAAAASGPAASAPGDLLADMLERLDGAMGVIGEYADRARIAGQACERSYDALTPQ